MVFRLVVAMILAAGISGCMPRTIVRTETVTVEIPVPIKREAPAFLMAPIAVAPPEFVALTHPEATSGLTAQGEKNLKILVLALVERLRQWEAWASAQ